LAKSVDWKARSHVILTVNNGERGEKVDGKIGRPECDADSEENM